ncbi:SIR2 family protein [Pseudomonas sp. P115]|uniref:SIR2 family protein n=1 Tax=Pseudomonas pisciculturae TaxID=2730413 RepID=UPI001891F940|nr:SIR2 family protein [Pseudomonas pisciculturae]MBF6028866.1 SIR2 family protein [Pseudomonas pisciculturae]
MSGCEKIENVKRSAEKGELVVVVGTGVSLALTSGKYPHLSWSGLIKSGFDYALEKGRIDEPQRQRFSSQLESPDVDELLSAAEFMGKKMDSPSGDLYKRWMYSLFDEVNADSNQMYEAVRAIAALNIPIATLNYDTLVEDVSGLRSISVSDLRSTTNWMRGTEKGVLHLHGSWKDPESCVLGIRDYEKTIGSETRDLFQRSLGVFKRLLFIGCGDTFSDPNFSVLIHWLRSNMGATALQHYALVSNDQCPKRNKDLSWHGFVEPIGFGDNRSELPSFIIKLVSEVKGGVHVVPRVRKTRSDSEKHESLLKVYRDFLLKDCGEMAIEGIRADMETARKRFDLEQLFVPLDLTACPPYIPLDDVEREKKLALWEEKNKKPKSFGEVFRRSRGLALLALPGGGKTLLLKRLAVAYCSEERRSRSSDLLPDEELMPVLIRCREWRDHITLPIATLLKKLGDITGHSSLSGLGKALIPLLKDGRVLLLVDGLDEIHDNGDRTAFVENLKRFLDSYPKIRVVITSREAGFSLVAPCLMECCELWRVAPLSRQAITLLCEHWHRLMVVNMQVAMKEAAALSEQLTKTVSLRRLAENPLLLTMLLVVKHGAGRLPPDRVSLYGRAVELLLDTWNIKGHEALNIKEAVPQLSYVALELMRSGQQTATEKELLILLEKARDNVPQIKRYARDTPYDFLKRVELRSSLLLEAGHQVENGNAVPFYQFRHLTFQEYLAAIAISEGNYEGFDSRSTILKPLSNKLAVDEWKEVIPMAAVLAGKQAEPLVAALVKRSLALKKKHSEDRVFPGKVEWLSGRTLPSDISRLVQSLAEEAEAESDTITKALNVIVYFARGCRSGNDWRALSCGPYGEELLHQAWLLYRNMDWPDQTWVRNSYASLAAFRKPATYWLSAAGQKEMMDMVNDPSPEKTCLGLMTYVGLLWNQHVIPTKVSSKFLPVFEAKFKHQVYAVKNIAVWSWGLSRFRSSKLTKPTLEVLDDLLKIWLLEGTSSERSICGMAFATCEDIGRYEWRPSLPSEAIELLRNMTVDEWSTESSYFGRIFIAFHSGVVWSDEELVAKITAENGMFLRDDAGRHWKAVKKILEQIEPYGVDFLKDVKPKARGRRVSRVPK